MSAKPVKSSTAVMETPIAARSAKPEPNGPRPAPISNGVSLSASPSCNICNGTVFKPGPENRLAPGDIAPLCTQCNSFERHRAVRDIFDKLRGKSFAQMNALQFGRDRCIAGGWFKSLKRTAQDPKNPSAPFMTVEKIALPDASMDVVISNFGLEYVADYRTALREIGRVISDHGFAFIAVQNPAERKVTREVAGAVNVGSRRRTFGQDFEKELPALLPDLHVIRTIGTDPITGVEAWGHFITMDDEFAASLFEYGIRARFVNIRKILA